MASSSSSSSHLIPSSSSSSKSWNYEVFLSFRGEDTRKTFVDHLYTSLVQQGIVTYKDDETLPRGESIGPSLLKSIGESRIAVVVFSENYADSSWCLDELAYIMECMATIGQIVMPVFYDVDPSDVRKQNGKYGEAFAKYDLENNHKVESWKNALVGAGNLSGWVPKDFANGHEAKCIKDIVGSISSELYPLRSKFTNDLIGIETRLQDLKSELETGPSGSVRIVGIWGVGGGGKTTLAYAAYTEMSVHFEGCCFLENIREESSKHGLKMLQEKMLSFVLKTGVPVKSIVEEGRSIIERRLCHKKVLVVLDDVDDLKQIEALAGSHDWFGEGSRIIITTRNEHLLTRKADSVYVVSLLSHDEAIKLFHSHAYREDKPVEDYDILSEKVVSYAGGLPLALKVLGSFLYDKDKDEWMSALDKLKDIPNRNVMERLRISYDGLDLDEKQLFLDIACFFRKGLIETAMEVLKAFRLNLVIGVRVLVQKSLIYELNGVFDMHDLIEEMAHHIVREEDRGNPEKHSRVWKSEDILQICNMDTTTVNDRIQALVVSNNSYPPCLPQVLANMKNARWISLENYPKSSLPTNFQPKKLGCLTLRYGLQKELWQGVKYLGNLKILDLRNSDQLKRTPDFNGLPCLERLNLGSCIRLKEVHPSIGHHERLVYVNMAFCEKLKMFPPIIRMQKLQTLLFTGCKRLWKFPEFKTNMNALKELHLEGTAIEMVPSCVGDYCTNLVSLKLMYCWKLKRIECNFRLLKHLKKFHILGSGRLDKLADNFFDMECCLEELFFSIKQHDKPSLFKQILDNIYQGPVSMKFPPFPRFLRRLHLHHCDLGDGDIPSDISELSCLQVLDLSSNMFSCLPSNLTQLSCLKFLNVSYSYNLVELPNLPSSIAILNLNCCRLLASLGDLSIYKWLWKVSCEELKKGVGGVRVLHSMLQGNAVENHFLSLYCGPPSRQLTPQPTTFTLQLPHNWYNDFSGFLFCVDRDWFDGRVSIVIKQEETRLDFQPDDWPEFDKNLESDGYSMVGYVSFASLRHTSWWNSAYSKLSFEVECDYELNFKVGLVPRKCEGDSNEREKGAIDSSELWDEEEVGDKKTFGIVHDSKSSIMIEWRHRFLF